MLGLNILAILKHPGVRKFAFIALLLGSFGLVACGINNTLKENKNTINSLTEAKSKLEAENANQAKTITQQNATIARLNVLQDKDHQQEIKDDAHQAALQSENDRLKASLRKKLDGTQYQISMPDDASKLLKQAIDSLNGGTN